MSLPNKLLIQHYVILVMSLKLMMDDVAVFAKPHMRNMIPGRKYDEYIKWRESVKDELDDYDE